MSKAQLAVPGPASEEGAFLDGSTAPTTPEGSLSFSPVLRPRQAGPAGGDHAMLTPRLSPENDAAVAPFDAPAPIPDVRTICCVGAGYVGM
jgi:UDPglucose 6-dehydrogenase